MKTIKNRLPEIYFILFSLWWFLATEYGTMGGVKPNYTNYPAIILLLIIVLQLFIKNRVMGITIPAILGLASLYLVLALWSDVIKQEFDSGTASFVVRTLAIIVANISMSIWMIRNYYYRRAV